MAFKRGLFNCLKNYLEYTLNLNLKNEVYHTDQQCHALRFLRLTSNDDTQNKFSIISKLIGNNKMRPFI